MSHLLDEILRAQKRGEPRGITSICSAHPAVLECALRNFRPVLIEATCNQVNQFGGYTGMTPADFYQFIHQKAQTAGFPVEKLILGGDHLGPAPWQALPAKDAMQKAEELVRTFVRAGFTKLHIDASMRLGGDDPEEPLDLTLSAHRTAILIKAAEKAAKDISRLRYVVGTEVPVPGGAHEHEEGVQITQPATARETLEGIKAALEKAGSSSAWERVIALVVQPGVEFGSDFVLDYDPGKATGLAIFSESEPVIYEAHSTDYQKPAALRNLVRDHFAILKVGPALTFAYREAVFALAMMEDELFMDEERSHLIQVMEASMEEDPKYWHGYYQGSPGEIAYQRKYSFSDRIRYYWKVPEVEQSVTKLLGNWTGREIPPSLASQYLPDIETIPSSTRTKFTAEKFIDQKIRLVLESYYQACGYSPR